MHRVDPMVERLSVDRIDPWVNRVGPSLDRVGPSVSRVGSLWTELVPPWTELVPLWTELAPIFEASQYLLAKCYDDAMGAPCIVAGGEHANLELWSLELRGKKLGTLQGHRKGIRDVACFSDAGNRAARILSAADDLTVRLWCPSTMICLAIYIADAPLLSFSALAAAEDSRTPARLVIFILEDVEA